LTDHPIIPHCMVCVTDSVVK